MLWIKACTILHNLLFQSFYDPSWGDVEDVKPFDDHPIDSHTYQSERAERRVGQKLENIKVRILNANGHMYDAQNRFIR